LRARLIIEGMESKFCPKCGAYWQCECTVDVVEVRPSEFDRLAMPSKPGCQHDWTEAVGVEVDDDLILGEAQVMVCRLCGIYAVEEKSA
jgi:hypothetical protein